MQKHYVCREFSMLFKNIKKNPDFPSIGANFGVIYNI